MSVDETARCEKQRGKGHTEKNGGESCSTFDYGKKKVGNEAAHSLAGIRDISVIPNLHSAAEPHDSRGGTLKKSVTKVNHDPKEKGTVLKQAIKMNFKKLIF